MCLRVASAAFGGDPANGGESLRGGTFSGVCSATCFNRAADGWRLHINGAFKGTFHGTFDGSFDGSFAGSFTNFPGTFRATFHGNSTGRFTGTFNGPFRGRGGRGACHKPARHNIA